VLTNSRYSQRNQWVTGKPAFRSTQVKSMGGTVQIPVDGFHGCVPPSTQGALNKVSRLLMLMVVGASRDIMPKAAF